MKKNILYIIIIFITACESSSGKSFEPVYSINSGHPRLYLTKQRIDDIRLRCSDKRGAQAKYYLVLKEFADKYVPNKSKPSVYDCFCLAFLNVIGELPGYDYSPRSVDEYGKIAVEILIQLYPPEDLEYFKKLTPLLIACYDWLFPNMNSTQRSKVYEHYISGAEKMREAMGKVIGGRFRETREMYAFYGLAFYGDGKDIYPENPGKAALVDKTSKSYCDFFASWWRDQNLALLEKTCKEGAYPAGTMYGEAPYPLKLWAMDAWETASKDKLYESSTAITDYPLFWLYLMLPYPSHVRFDNANGWANHPGGIVRFGDYRYLGFTAVASNHTNINFAQAQGVYFHQGNNDLASVLNWLIQQQGDFTLSAFGGPYPTNKWIGATPLLVWDIIFRNGLVEAKSPHEANLPLARHFGATTTGGSLKPDYLTGRPEGAGIVVIRSSWKDPGGTLVWFKASSTPIVHDHRDQGSFQIYKKGWLAIDSGQYEETPHRGNYYSRTVAHNSLLIYNPRESLDKEKADPVWKGYANDGGQRWIEPPKTSTESEEAKYFMGGLNKFESKPGYYDYLHADITRSYNSTNVTTEGHNSKVSLVTRSLLYIRPDDIIIMFDRVQSTQAEYPKRWLLHSIYRPELNGEESFTGIIPYSKKIPGKIDGVKLKGNLNGGISESLNTDKITIKGWNFGPTDGRLLIKTILPVRHITRIVGGSDNKGTPKTILTKAYDNGDTIYVKDTTGFSEGDFVYIGETEKPYSDGSRGRPNWPVNDVNYQGWGKVKSVEPRTGGLTFFPYRYGIPKVSEGTVVARSDHANNNSYEFMDAEYNQWQLHGEAVANAGPYNMQHGNWRIEVEPIEQSRENIFLHVLMPCDSNTYKHKIKMIDSNVVSIDEGNKILITINGMKFTTYLTLYKNSSHANLKIMESGKLIHESTMSN